MRIIKQPQVSDEIEIIPFKENANKSFVTYFDDVVQAGFASPAEDFIDRTMSLDEYLITHPTSTFFVRVKGLSMFPTLQQDDLLVVRSDLDMQDKDIVIVSVNNTDFTVKRYDKKKNMLVADNDQFPSITLQEDDIVISKGVVDTIIRRPTRHK